MPPININYEPTPFLQVMGSWWGQRRQMAHGVAVQEAQIGLQHSAQAQQSFQSGMTGLRQGAAAYQQAQQFEAGLSQQQQLATQGMEHAFEMADYKNFGMRAHEIDAAMQADIVSGSISADMTLPQYKRRLESERLKVAQDTQTQQAIQQHWISKTGQSPQQLQAAWTSAGGAETGYGSWQEHGIAIGEQRQLQFFAATARQQKQAIDLGDAIKRLRGSQEHISILKAHDAAQANLESVQQGHDIGISLPEARAKFEETSRDVVAARRTLETDPDTLQANFKAHVLSTPIVNPATGEVVAIATSVPKPEGSQVSITMPDKMIFGVTEGNYWSGLNNAYDNEIRAWGKVADAFAKSFTPKLIPEPPTFAATKARYDATLREGKLPQQGARSPVDAQARERYRALGMPLPGAQQAGAQLPAPLGAPEKMPPERANAINFIAQMQRTGRTIEPGQLKNLMNTYLSLARRELGPGASDEEYLSRAKALMIEDGGGEIIE